MGDTVIKDINISDEALLKMATDAEHAAYAPYSEFRVGAALLCSDGSIYTGCNIENSAFGAGICVERTAMSKAISEGHRSFLRIAVSGNGGEAWPCGICRQFMYEFAPDMDVITADPAGGLASCRLSDLLQHGFSLNTDRADCQR